MQIIIKLTTACNLNCVYCSEGDKCLSMLKKSLVYKLIDDLPVLMEKYHDENIELLWHGGEPLIMGKQYLDDVMSYAKQRLVKYKLKFSIQSNGTLIDEQWIEIFKKYDVGVGISLDGYQEIHDKNRKSKDGKPTFQKIMDNIQKLQDAGITVGTLMVLNTEQEVDVDKLLDVIKKIGGSTKVHCVIPCGRAEGCHVDQIYDNYVKLMRELYIKALGEEETIVIEPLNEIMDTILNLDRIHECSYNGTCGVKFICLYSDGAVGFCGRSEHEDEFIYGNLSDSGLLDLYESQKADLIRSRCNYLMQHDCKNCQYWELCHGGCSFEAVNAYGTLFQKFPACEMRKKLIDFLKDEGIEILKQHLLKQKRKCRLLIKERKRMIEELKNAE